MHFGGQNVESCSPASDSVTPVSFHLKSNFIRRHTPDRGMHRHVLAHHPIHRHTPEACPCYACGRQSRDADPRGRVRVKHAPQNAGGCFVIAELRNAVADVLRGAEPATAGRWQQLSGIPLGGHVLEGQCREQFEGSRHSSGRRWCDRWGSGPGNSVPRGSRGSTRGILHPQNTSAI